MAKRPNIVFVLSDDQCPHSLGCLHNSELRTPNLDTLAEEGVRFSNCFCGSPVCSPARATILTGSIPSRHGVHDWIRSGNINPSEFDFSNETKEHYDYLIENKSIDYLKGLTTYTELLNDSGYNCALAGKWHLGDSVHPQHGFKKWCTIGKGGCDNYMDPDVIEDGKITFPKKYITDIITDKAIEYIDELSKEDKPFYINVNYIAPHTPWEHYSHKKEFLDLYKDCDFEKYYPHLKNHPWASESSKSYNTPEKRAWLFAGYEASITAMDDGIGKIIAELKNLGIYDDTLIIFTSDNGFNMGQHGIFGKGNGTYPTNVYEESIKVPFIMKWNGAAPRKKVLEDCISHYDLFPTILDIAGVDYKLDAKQPGESFVDVLMGEKDRRTEPVFIYDEYGATRMVRTPQFKYVHRFPDGPHELYDLVSDPTESVNLYGMETYENVTEDLKKQLFDWFDKYIDPNRDGIKNPANGSGQLLNFEDEDKDKVFFHND